MGDVEARRLFRALRKLGGPLRAGLDPSLLDQLRFNGFLSGADEQAPTLTFQESGQRAPILWDMMYEAEEEEDTDEVALDWRRFWGFRVPIAHWTHLNRTDEIRLRHGLFAAVAEDLELAGRETESLLGRLRRHAAAVPHANLTGAFCPLPLPPRPQGHLVRHRVEGWLTRQGAEAGSRLSSIPFRPVVVRSGRNGR